MHQVVRLCLADPRAVPSPSHPHRFHSRLPPLPNVADGISDVEAGEARELLPETSQNGGLDRLPVGADDPVKPGQVSVGQECLYRFRLVGGNHHQAMDGGERAHHLGHAREHLQAAPAAHDGFFHLQHYPQDGGPGHTSIHHSQVEVVLQQAEKICLILQEGPLPSAGLQEGGHKNVQGVYQHTVKVKNQQMSHTQGE